MKQLGLRIYEAYKYIFDSNKNQVYSWPRQESKQAE